MTKPTTKLKPDELLTHLHDALGVLGLTELRRALDESLDEPIQDESRLAWLWRLVEPQLRRRVESRAERRVRESKLPVRKTFEAFNFAFQPKLDKDLVMELATLRFLAQGKNVLLAGMTGTGKSHIALALALLACNANRRVLYTTSADMLARLTMGLADDTLARALKPYTRAELLVVDEVGLEQVERNEARRSGLMQKVLLPRYNHAARRSSPAISRGRAGATTSAITSAPPPSSIAWSTTATSSSSTAQATETGSTSRKSPPHVAPTSRRPRPRSPSRSPPHPQHPVMLVGARSDDFLDRDQQWWVRGSASSTTRCTGWCERPDARLISLSQPTRAPTCGPQPHPDDPAALRTYEEHYLWDAVGNIVELQHVASGGNFTRQYRYDDANDSNRLMSNSAPGESTSPSPTRTPTTTMAT